MRQKWILWLRLPYVIRLCVSFLQQYRFIEHIKRSWQNNCSAGTGRFLFEQQERYQWTSSFAMSPQRLLVCYSCQTRDRFIPKWLIWWHIMELCRQTKLLRFPCRTFYWLNYFVFGLSYFILFRMKNSKITWI